jgi:hypothetical protein
LVDARMSKGVFRVVTVEISVVDTHSPLAGFMGTSTGLASQTGFLHSRMNPVSKSFRISTLMTSLRSFAKRRNFGLTGLAILLTSRECSASSLGTPSISDGVHANMSALSRRKLVSASSYFSPRLSPMTTVLVASARQR